VTGRRAIVAPARADRPMLPADFCPFCPGGEWDTPGEVYAVREAGSPADGPGWRLRVVPNKFPAVRPDAADGFGFHEVLIDSPRHLLDPADLTADETRAGLVAIRERVRELGRRPGVGRVTAFRNVGAEAGASLAHTHAQIVATPDPGPEVRTGPPGRLVVAETPRFRAVCPPVPRFDHEVWLLPTEDRPRFADAADDELAEFAGLLRRVRRAVRTALGRPAYNELLFPVAADRWRLEVCPRTARLAGFELATGTFILTVPPERSAEVLRAAIEGES
jgi:UDPglucose--hexose-1-phosphate uridylyltransferase